MKTRLAVLVVFLIYVVFFATDAWSAPVAAYKGNGATITLFDEECRLKDQVTNLGHRSTWVEKGRTFEGCWQAHPGGFVIIYSSDKTIAIIPAHVFERVTGV